MIILVEKIARRLTRKPKLVAFIGVLLLIPALLGIIGTRINYDILTYLPQDSEAAQGEKILEEPFKMAATSMLIVDGMPAGYSNDLINQIQEVDGVSNAVWLSNMVGIQIPTNLIPAEFRDVFFSGDATMMIIQYDRPGASDETMSAISEIRKICNEKCFLAGFSVVIKDTRDLVDKELPMFVLLAVILSLIALGLAFESWVLPAILMVNIGFAILYNFGTNIIFGEISYITKAIAAVLQLGVTMDYSIFLYKRYEEEKPNYEDERDAMARAVEAAFASLSSSSLTTVAGFLALCFMRLTLGRDIGLVMAKGVIIGVATVICILPSFILILDRPMEKYKHRTFVPNLTKANDWVIRRRKLIAVIFLLLFLPSMYAENHATVYYKLDESLPQDIPSIVANKKLKNDFDMATSHFIMLSDDIVSTDMNVMESDLKNVDGVTNLISYHSILGTGIPDFFIPDEAKSMLKQGGYQMLMVNSEYDTASDAVAEQLDEIRSIVKKYDPNALVTGEAAMTDELIDVTAKDFVTTNYISILAIFLIIALTFKSISVPVVLVATIELAIFINQACPYFLGTEVPFIAPTVISCVQLGATVDYAILVTTRFREEIQSGHDRREAIRIAMNTSYGSIITSALVLFCATLGVSFVSSIDLIGSLCIMLARGAVISAIVCIFMMPAILYICEPIFAKTSYKWRG